MPESVMNENEWVRLEAGSASLMEEGIKEILLVFIRRTGFIKKITTSPRTM